MNIIIRTHFDNIYAFGAQGPDFFYYIGKFNPLTKHRYSEVGNQVHELATKALFREMLNFMTSKPSEALMAYISGFISHYIISDNASTCPIIIDHGTFSRTFFTENNQSIGMMGVTYIDGEKNKN